MSHIHDKIDFTVSAYIVHEDKVLLRRHEKYHQWYAVGGHIELNEDPIEGVYREVEEETGLRVKIIADPVLDFSEESQDLQLPIAINRHFVGSEQHEHVDLVYATSTSTAEIKPQEGEASDPKDFRWLTAAEVESLDDIKPRVKHYALLALKKAQNQ